MSFASLKESYVFAPSKIAHKARQLADVGLFEKALELLERNKVEYDVYPYKVVMRTAAESRLKKR